LQELHIRTKTVGLLKYRDVKQRKSKRKACRILLKEKEKRLRES